MIFCLSSCNHLCNILLYWTALYWHSTVFTQSNSNLVCTLIGWLFKSDSLLGHVGQILAQKWLKLVVSDCSLKKYSLNIIQTWCLHLLGQCSQLICFWGTLRWPNFGPLVAKKLMKLSKNGHFRPSTVNYPLNPINSWCPHLFGEASEMIPFFLAMTKQLSEWFSPSVYHVVGLFILKDVCQSLEYPCALRVLRTYPHGFLSSLVIQSLWICCLGNYGNFGEVINGSDQSKVKVTEVKTHLCRFWTVTQVLIHIW